MKSKKDIINDYGGWSAHNIYLGNGEYTISKNIAGDEFKLNRIVQIVKDNTFKPIEKLRILDLACLEGLYSIEFAKMGAEVLALDARKGNLEKVKFSAEKLGLDSVRTVKDDVRNISLEKYGEFDVILCLGIFYHLDGGDLYDFIKRMHSMVNRILIIDTQISVTKNHKFSDNGLIYYGKRYTEHLPSTDVKTKERDVWKSYDNLKSFKLTRSSLIRMLSKAGFTSVSEALFPNEPGKFYDRITLTAIKGDRVTEYNSPLMDKIIDAGIEERDFKQKFNQAFVIFKNFVKYHIKLRTPVFIKKIYREFKTK